MKIRSVAILGAGAVGSYLLWGLTDKSGVTVSVVAEGARADRLRRAGCTINGKTYRPQVLSFSKNFSSFIGREMLQNGSDTYHSTVSFPSTLPALVTVTSAVIF